LSGSCTKTTLGNTLRVAMYWRMLALHLGYTTNWTYEMDDNGGMYDVYIHVAGDDVVMFARESVAAAIQARFQEHFSRDKSDRRHGNGQCVTKIDITDKYDIDFCSKVSM